MLRSVTDLRHFCLALCCHQWKATAKVEHQTRAANKALVRTVCRHKLDTAFTFVSLSGWDPSQLCPASHKKSGTFRTNFWYMIFMRKQEEDCMSPWFSLYSKEGKYIYSASISFFFALYPSIYLSSNYSSDVILKHIVPYRAITHDAFCNYLRRHSYLYVILYIIYNMRILE